MNKEQNKMLPGRRQVVLGLTGFIGMVVTGCSLDSVNKNNSVQSTSTSASTPTATATSQATQTTAAPTATAGTTLLIYKGHTNWVNDLVWSPDSTSIASYSASSSSSVSKKQDYSVRVWNVSDGRERFIHQTNGLDTQPTLAWSPDGSRIAISTLLTSSSGATFPVVILNAQTGSTLATCADSLSFACQIAWSPDSAHVAAAEGTGVLIFDAQTGKRTFTYKPGSSNDNFFAVAWSPDGSTIASSSSARGNSVQFWNARNGQSLSSYVGDGGAPYALAWSPDGKSVAIRTYSEIQAQIMKTGQVTLTTTVDCPMRQKHCRAHRMAVSIPIR